MTNTYNYAQQELDVLIKSCPDPDDRPIIEEFIPEILAICEKFGKSGQSGGSAPYTASALSQAIKKLCLHEPICPITGIDEEWVDVTEYFESGPIYQNKRCGSIFKNGKNGRAYYLDAIVFKGDSGSIFTSNSGGVSTKSGKKVFSSQYIKSFPFTPKTFYIDVNETEWADKEETIKQKGGGWWTSIIKDESQLKKVWKVYDIKDDKDGKE